MRLQVFGLALASLLAVCGAASAQSPPAGAAPPTAPEPGAKPGGAEEGGEKAQIDGFRSARWGMTEAEVKAAIKKDFNIPPDKIAAENNLAERTNVLTVAVPDLLEGAGAAKISYIFGYASKKMIQVNVLWGTAIDSQMPGERIVAAANQLRQLFLNSGYQPNTVVSNAKMSDGSILVFEGQDAQNHTTILRLASTIVTPPASRAIKEPKPVVTTALSLSYVLDARNPDVYRLKKGQF